MNPTTCQSCDSADRIALSGDEWLCAKCHPPMACPRCGRVCAAVGVGRFGILSAESNATYDREQEMGFRCRSTAHERPFLFLGEGHMGPGTRKPPQVYDALHVYVDGVLLMEGKAGE